MYKWLCNNRTWVFSGIGVVVIVAVVGLVWRLVPSIERPELSITVPQEGRAVGPDENIRGGHAVRGHNYYPLVTPLETGVAFVAGPLIDVHPDGSWEGHARFGEVGTAAGTEFRLEVVESGSPLAEGALRDPAAITARFGTVHVARR